MKKKLVLLICLTALLLCGCRQQPPAGLVAELPEEAQIIAAEPQEGSSLQFTGTLYFRYGDTPLLRQEEREIVMQPNETREKALVSALLEGSREAGSRPLFPEKTEVLSTQAQDGMIYITFNEALYGRYADESRAPGEASLRRELAVAALTAALTESGEYAAVQVLVRAEENVGRSMRLTQGFFGGDDDGIVPPFTRQQDALPTGSAYARELLEAWQARDWEALRPYLTARSASAQSGWEERLAALPVLIEAAVYEGTVSPDGGSAVVCADLLLRDSTGAERRLEAYPLRLVRENGAWKAELSQLTRMMGEENE